MARFDKSIVDCCVAFLCYRSVVTISDVAIPPPTAENCHGGDEDSIVTGSSKGSSDGAVWYAR